MTLLLRKFDHAELLIKLTEAELAAPPLWLVKAFMPEHKEGGTISLFEVDTADDGLPIAAAMGIFKPTLKTKVAFLTCDRSSLENLGLQVSASSGDTHHEWADARHRDLHLPTAEAAITAARSFAAGDPLIYEGKVVERAAQNSMRQNHFSCQPLAGREHTGKHLLSFIRDQVAVIQGVPTT